MAVGTTTGVWASRRNLNQISSDRSNHEAVRVPEAALLQNAPDLESGHHGSPQVDSTEAARPAAEDAVPQMRVSIPSPQLTTEANQASRARAYLPVTSRVTAGQAPVTAGTSTVPPSVAITAGTCVILNLSTISHEHIFKNPSLAIAFACALVSFSFGFLTLFTQIMMSRGTLPLSWSKYLPWFSMIPLPFTLVALTTSFVPKTYWYLPIVFVPAALAVIYMTIYPVPSNDDVVGIGDDPQLKADEERSHELSVSMTTISIAGAIAVTFGYHKNRSNRAGVAIYLMLSASLMGILTLLLRRLRSWKVSKKTIVAYSIMFCLLLTAVLMVATTFLGGAIAATPFPVLFAVATLYMVKKYQLWLEDYVPQEDETKSDYKVALFTMATSFGIVMAIFAGFLGGEGKRKNLEVCIFFAVSCFISSVILALATFRTPKEASMRATAGAMYYFSLLLLAVSALAVVSYVGS